MDSEIDLLNTNLPFDILLDMGFHNRGYTVCQYCNVQCMIEVLSFVNKSG